jgi:ADP-ribosylglycohydrolase
MLSIVLSEPGLLDDPLALRDALARRLAPMSELLAKKLEAVVDLVARDALPGEAARVLGTSTLAAESVPVALWSFVSAHASFAQAVSSAALVGGDVDSICCLVGALAGALHGAQLLDSPWATNLAHERPSPAEIMELADSLHSLRPSPPRLAERDRE